MVYTIYETNCIIFDIKNIQENDSLIKGFSDKFGFINIIATSFRKSTSKLKGNIKAYSVNTVSLVKGKEFFRLTDVSHIYSFSNSKSLVKFLRIAENLFFNDERDYFDVMNDEVYKMMIHLSKFIIYIVKSENDNKKNLLDIINVFFTVYVRGLQGFVEKINIDMVFNLENESLSDWMYKQKNNLNTLYNKII